MEPVEIELRMKQNLDSESKKAKQGIEGVSDAAEKAQGDITENITIQKKVIAQLQKELKPLQAAFDKVNIGTSDPKVIAERKRLSGVIRQMTADLRAEEKALTELEQRTGSTTQKMTSLRTQMMNVRNAMGALKLAGKENTAEYARLEEQLGTLGTAYRELRTVEQAVSTGGTQLAGFMDGLNALTGTISAGAGAVALFNGDSEKMAEIQTKLQGIMAISIGLMQVSNALHSTSAFRITTVATAKRLWAAANLKVATTLGITNVQAKALMATLTLGLSVAITAVIYLFDKFISQQKKAAEETKKFTESVSEGSAEQLASYDKLRKSYQALNGDIEKQTQFLEDNKKEFEDLGVAFNNVNEAEHFFNNEGKQAFKAGIIERAKSIALMEMVAEKYKTVVAKELKYEKMNDTKQVYQAAGQFARGSFVTVENNDKKNLKKEIDKQNKEIDDYITRSLKHQENATKAFLDAGINNTKTILEGTKDWWEAQKKAAGEKLAAMRETEKGTEAWTAQLAKYKHAEQKLKTWNFNDKQNTAGANKQAQAVEKLRKLNISLQEETDAAVIAAMNEGASKKLAALEADYNKRKTVIAEKLREIEKLEKISGQPATAQRTNLKALGNAVDTQYANDKALIEEATATEVQKVWDEVNTRFRSDLDNRLLETQKFYDNQLRLLQENITKESVLKEAAAALDKKRQQELNQIKIDAALRELDFRTEIALKEQTIANRSIFWEADRQKKLMQIQLDAAKERLQKLKALQTNGIDSSQDIARTEQAIKGLNVGISDLGKEKINEINGKVQQIIGSLTDFIALFDESLAQGLEWTAQFADAVTSIASGDIIGGADKLLGTITQVINANRQANKEIREFNYSLAQDAINYSLKVIDAIKDIKGEYDNIFINDSQNTLSQSMAGYSAAIKEQAALTEKLGETTIKTGKKKKKFLGITTGTKDKWGNLLDNYQKVLKTSDELIDDAGNLNMEMAQALMESGKLSKEAKDILQQMIVAENSATAAMQQFENQLQSLVGTIGSDLKDALDDAFRSGTDSAEKMTNNIAGLMEQLLSEIAFNSIFGELLKDFQESAKASYGAGGDDDLTDDLSDFLSDYQTKQDQYYAELERIRAIVKGETGVDPYADEDGRSGFTEGIAQASQDSIDELNGRVMAISGNVYHIKEGNVQLLTFQKEALTLYRTFSTQLDAIAANTAFCRYLEDIDATLTNIKDKGVKLK